MGIDVEIWAAIVGGLIAALVTSGAVMWTNHHTSKLSREELRAAEHEWSIDSKRAADARVADRLQEGVSRALLAAVDYHDAIVTGRTSIESQAAEYLHSGQLLVDVDAQIVTRRHAVDDAKSREDDYFRRHRAHLQSLQGEVKTATRVLDDLTESRAKLVAGQQLLVEQIDNEVRHAVRSPRRVWSSAIQVAALMARQVMPEVDVLGEHLERAELAATRPDGESEMLSRLAMSVEARHQLTERSVELIDRLTTAG